jgi:hypothetical protein
LKNLFDKTPKVARSMARREQFDEKIGKKNDGHSTIIEPNQKTGAVVKWPPKSGTLEDEDQSRCRRLKSH